MVFTNEHMIKKLKLSKFKVDPPEAIDIDPRFLAADASMMTSDAPSYTPFCCSSESNHCCFSKERMADNDGIQIFYVISIYPCLSILIYFNI